MFYFLEVAIEFYWLVFLKMKVLIFPYLPVILFTFPCILPVDRQGQKNKFIEVGTLDKIGRKQVVRLISSVSCFQIQMAVLVSSLQWFLFPLAICLGEHKRFVTSRFGVCGLCFYAIFCFGL